MTQKKVRRPEVGDRIGLRWHVGRLYYAGTIDNVFTFKRKRYYDITYDTLDKEYYLDLNIRKWKFLDESSSDESEVESKGAQNIEEEEEMLEEDYPKKEDNVKIMWHVDRKYYSGKVIDVKKIGKTLLHDVEYEDGECEYFIDLKYRKWSYRLKQNKTRKQEKRKDMSQKKSSTGKQTKTSRSSVARRSNRITKLSRRKRQLANDKCDKSASNQEEECFLNCANSKSTNSRIRARPDEAGDSNPVLSKRQRKMEGPTIEDVESEYNPNKNIEEANNPVTGSKLSKMKVKTFKPSTEHMMNISNVIIAAAEIGTQWAKEELDPISKSLDDMEEKLDALGDAVQQINDGSVRH